jgi:hypothetical protein
VQQPTKHKLILVTLSAWCCLLSAAIRADQQSGTAASGGKTISKAAADRCESKIKSLETYASANENRKKRATRFTEEEINSYFALRLSANYHPSLKSIQFDFAPQEIQSLAQIDFDALNMNSTKLLTKLIAKMFTGTHRLQARGKLVAEGGKGYFQLSEARFDDTTLPNFLVEQIITAVGRKQKPPFDPLQPSQLPYRIERVEVQKGLIVVHQ